VCSGDVLTRVSLEIELCCVFWYWADSSELSKAAELCVTEIQLYTFINLSTRKVSHLKIPVWATVYRLITEIRQI